MAINNTQDAFNRRDHLNEGKSSGRPYVVNLSDIRELGKGEKDIPFVGGGGSCIDNPNVCGHFQRGKGRCDLVLACKFRCPNIERSG